MNLCFSRIRNLAKAMIRMAAVAVVESAPCSFGVAAFSAAAMMNFVARMVDSVYASSDRNSQTQ